MSYLSCFTHNLQTIIQDTNERIKKSAHQEDVLQKGVWYASEYYRILFSKQKTRLIEKLISRNVFFEGLAPDDVMYLAKDPKSPTGYAPLSFAIKKKVEPSYALEKLEEGLSLLDCSTVVMLSAYKALCTVLGEEKFNVLFSHASPFALSLQGKSFPLARILSKRSIKNEQEIEEGDICYFSNINEYIAKHPLGESRGDHLVCLKKDPHLYIGFGLPHLGLDKIAIEKELWDCFNRSPIDLCFFKKPIIDYLHSHYFSGDIEKGKKLVSSFKEKIVSWEDFEKKPARAISLGLPCFGKLGLWVYRFHLSRIEQLISCKKEHLIELFASFPV